MPIYVRRFAWNCEESFQFFKSLRRSLIKIGKHLNASFSVLNWTYPTAASIIVKISIRLLFEGNLFSFMSLNVNLEQKIA